MVVSIVCLVTMGMVQGGRMWETVIFSLTLGGVRLGVVFAIGMTAERRQFWLGFAVAAGSYLAFVHLADNYGAIPRRDGPEFTTRVLFWSVQKLHDDLSPDIVRMAGRGNMSGGMFSVADIGPDGPSRVFKIDQGGGLSPDAGMTDLVPGRMSRMYQPDSATSGTTTGFAMQIMSTGEPLDLTPQFRIGHCGWALLFGWLGGHLSSWLCRRSASLAK